jgi:DNA-directed RNA polymerase subunit RPC12/RpoP
MGYKNICLKCRTSYSKGNDLEVQTETNCPQCAIKMTLVNHKFKPPKKTEIKQWEMVKLLVENGFKFQPVYEQIDKGLFLKINYPKNIRDAKEFIEKYKSTVSDIK